MAAETKEPSRVGRSRSVFADIHRFIESIAFVRFSLWQFLLYSFIIGALSLSRPAAAAGTISLTQVSNIYTAAFAQACQNGTGTYPENCSGTFGGADVNFDSPTAFALQGGATANSGSFPGFSAFLQNPNQQGQSGFAWANAPGANASAEAAAWVPFSASRPGYFDLTVNAVAEGVNSDFRAVINSTPGVLVTYMDSGEDAQAGPGFGPGVLYADIAGNHQGGVTGQDLGGNPTQIPSVGSSYETSNSMPLGVVVPYATVSDTIQFYSPGTDFYLFYNAGATSGLPCVPQQPCEPGPSFAFVDPIITPDPINPDITLTSSALPNPFPSAPLFSSSDLPNLTESDVQDLASLGLLPSETQQVPEPNSFALVVIGLVLTTFWSGLVSRA